MSARLYELKEKDGAGVLLIVTDAGQRVMLATRPPRPEDEAHDYAEYLRALADMVDGHAERLEAAERRLLASRGSVGVGGEELIASRARPRGQMGHAWEQVPFAGMTRVVLSCRRCKKRVEVADPAQLAGDDEAFYRAADSSAGACEPEART